MAKFDLATSMNGIMSDPAYQSVFLKTAAKKEDSKEEKAKKKEKEDKEKEKLKAKEEKEKAKAKEEKEKEKAKAKEEKAKKKKSSYEVCVMGLAKISELLDDAGLEKAASYALLSLDSLVKGAQEMCQDCGDKGPIVDMQPAKDDEVELVDLKPAETTDEYLDELLGDTEIENPEYKGDEEFHFDTLDAQASDVSSLVSLANDLRVVLAKGKKKEEEKDAKGKKDKKDENADKKNPFAKKDDKKEDKKDKKDEKKTKKAGFDFL